MELLVQSFIISLFCVGLRITSGEGMILYFLRKPFDRLLDIKDNIMIRKEEEFSGVAYLMVSIGIYVLKPVIGCITCMGSVWTLVIDGFFYGGIDKWSFLTIFVVCCLNTLIFNLYLKTK